MAGLPEYGTNRDMPGLYHSMALRQHHDNVRQGLALFDGSPQRFPPGSQFEYSSFSTLWIASVLQSATQHPFRTLMQTQVLAPPGLTSPVPDEANPDRARFINRMVIVLNVGAPGENPARR
jgi:serine beta-lactamase-like protein LACTB, mitochondrial